jgi:ribonuclease P protein subunit POP4
VCWAQTWYDTWVDIGRGRYDALMPLHRLWLGYMSELLSLPLRGATTGPSSALELGASGSEKPVEGKVDEIGRREVRTMTQEGFPPNTVANWQSKLVRADFSGCILAVSQSKNPSLVGVGGIVLQETAGTWRVVTSRNELKSECRWLPILSFVPRNTYNMSMCSHPETEFHLFIQLAIGRQRGRAGGRTRAGI